VRSSQGSEIDFKDLLKAIREWAEIGNPKPAKNANEKLSWLFQHYNIAADTPVGVEQQHTTKRRLAEALSRATQDAVTGGATTSSLTQMTWTDTTFHSDTFLTFRPKLALHQEGERRARSPNSESKSVLSTTEARLVS
jgi:hypothetical protein